MQPHIYSCQSSCGCVHIISCGKELGIGGLGSIHRICGVFNQCQKRPGFVFRDACLAHSVLIALLSSSDAHREVKPHTAIVDIERPPHIKHTFPVKDLIHSKWQSQIVLTPQKGLQL